MWDTPHLPPLMSFPSPFSLTSFNFTVNNDSNKYDDDYYYSLFFFQVNLNIQNWKNKVIADVLKMSLFLH